MPPRRSSPSTGPTQRALRETIGNTKKAKVWTRLPVNNISKVDLDFQKPHVVVVHCGKKECSFNLANPYVAASSFHFDGAATAWRTLVLPRRGAGRRTRKEHI